MAYRVSERTLDGLDEVKKVGFVSDYLDHFLCWLSPSKQKAFTQKYLDPNRDVATTLDPKVLLVLWRTLFIVCEQVAHCANRICQLFEWETTNDGPLFQLCRDPTVPIDFTPFDLDIYQNAIKFIESGVSAPCRPL